MNEDIIANITPVNADAASHAAEAASTASTTRTGNARPLPDDALIILPVRQAVLFPGVVLPLTVGRELARRRAGSRAPRAAARRFAAIETRRRLAGPG